MIRIARSAKQVLVVPASISAGEFVDRVNRVLQNIGKREPLYADYDRIEVGRCLDPNLVSVMVVKENNNV
jgi:hypothetical protein